MPPASSVVIRLTPEQADLLCRCTGQRGDEIEFTQEGLGLARGGLPDAISATDPGPEPTPECQGREALTIFYALADSAASAANQLLEAGGQHHVACRLGCMHCCRDYVRTTHAEAAAIAEWLLEPGREARLARFFEQLAEWREETGPEVWVLETWLTRHGGIPADPAEYRLCADALTAYLRRGLMCPFNGPDGSCEIYPIRPLGCRVPHVADTAENCRPGGTGLPLVIKHDTLTEIAGAAHDFLLDASRREGFDGELALPNAVERAIAARRGNQVRGGRACRATFPGDRTD